MLNLTQFRLHIRRTDKIGVESIKIPLSNYMDHVIRFFNRRRNLNHEKLVYVATDDSNEIKELSNQYPSYKFIHQTFQNHTIEGNNRYSSSEFQRLIVDISLLSECDLFVGTFSSQVSRVVYELMQLKFKDLPKINRAISVDDTWYNGAGIQPSKYKELISMN